MLRHYRSSLRFLGRCLSPFEDSRSLKHLRVAIKKDRVNWDSVVEIANAHRVVTALWPVMHAKGLHELLPGDLRDYLSELHRLNTGRNRALKSQLIQMLSLWNAVGIEPILIKGSAFLLSLDFLDPGERMMIDLDVLASPEDAAKMEKTLLSQRYEHVPTAPRREGMPHLCPLANNDQPAVVEIHVRLSREHDPQCVTFSEAHRRSRRQNVERVAFRVLHPCHTLFYTLFHSEVHHRGYEKRMLSLRSLRDFALLTRHFDKNLVWREFATLSHEQDLDKVVRAYLFTGHRLIGTPIPSGLEPSLTDSAPYYEHYFEHMATSTFIESWIPERWASSTPYRLLCNIGASLEKGHLRRMYGHPPGFWRLLGVRLRHCSHLIRTYLFGSKRNVLRVALFHTRNDDNL